MTAGCGAIVLSRPLAHSGGAVDWVSGRCFGRSSAVNGMLFVRGHPTIYDRMAQSGCSGWDYAQCLPYFRKLEDCRFSVSPNRAAGGQSVFPWLNRIRSRMHFSPRATNPAIAACPPRPTTRCA